MYVFNKLPKLSVLKRCQMLLVLVVALGFAPFPSPPTYAATNTPKHRLYLLGSLSTGLQSGPLRLGLFDWELGLLGAGSNGYSVGIAKLFYAGTTYTGFGPIFFGYNVFGRQSPGLFACIGKEYEWLSFLYFRAEFFMSVLADGSSEGGALLGLVVGW